MKPISPNLHSHFSRDPAVPKIMPGKRKKTRQECSAENCSYIAIGDGKIAAEQALQRHFIDVLNNNRITEVVKDAHRQNFNKCSHCGCIVIKRLINFERHVLQCQKSVKQMDRSNINPLEDSLASPCRGSSIVTSAQNLPSNMFISTSGNTDTGVSSRSRFLHLSSNGDYQKRSIDRASDSVPKRSKTDRFPNIPSSSDFDSNHHRSSFDHLRSSSDEFSNGDDLNDVENQSDLSYSSGSSLSLHDPPQEVYTKAGLLIHHEDDDDDDDDDDEDDDEDDDDDDDNKDDDSCTFGFDSALDDEDDDTKSPAPSSPPSEEGHVIDTIPPYVCGHDTNASSPDPRINDYVKKIRSHRRTKAIRSEYLPYLSIMKKATRPGVPEKLFNDIAKDVHHHFNPKARSADATLNHPSRKILTDYVSDVVHPPELKGLSSPKRERVVLPSGRQVFITLFDIRYQLALLFSDPILMKPENFVFPDGLNPFLLPDYKNGRLGEINMGLFHELTSKLLCPEGSGKFLAPFLGFIDAALIKFNSIEPLLLCPAFFKRHIRNTDRPWIVVGYIEPECNYIGTIQDKEIAKKNIPTPLKLTDYHAIIDRIFQDFRELQMTGFTIDMPGVRECTAVPVLQAVISDCKAGDSFSCRYGSHGVNVAGLVRDCDIPTKKAGDHKHVCKYHLKEFMKNLPEEDLNSRSFHKIFNNAFHKIYFGYCDMFGIYGATPPEALHVFRIGICVYLYEGFMNHLSQEMKIYLNMLSKLVVAQICRHGNGAYPLVDCFRHGIFHKKMHLSGEQKMSRIFLLYCCMMIPEFIDKLSKSSKRSTSKSEGFVWSLSIAKDWMKLFEYSVGFDAWLRSEEQDREPFFFPNFDPKKPNIEDVSAAQYRVRAYMKLFKKCVNRTHGAKLLLTKFHHLLHFVHYARIHGLMINFDGSRSESNGKTINIAPGKRTQNRVINLTYDTATKYVEYMNMETFSCILQCHHKKLYNSHDLKSQWVQTIAESNHLKYEIPPFLPDEFNDWKVGGSRFQIQHSPLVMFGSAIGGMTIYWRSTKYKLWDDNLLATLECRLFSGSKTNVFNGFTELRCPVYDNEKYEPKLKLVRAHPSYKSGNPWFSWVSILWGDDVEENAIYPAKVFMFFDTYGNLDLRDDPVLKCNRRYALIQSCVTGNIKKSVGSQLKTKCCTPILMEKSLRIVETESIDGCVLVIEHGKVSGSSYLIESASLLKYPWELEKGFYQ